MVECTNQIVQQLFKKTTLLEHALAMNPSHFPAWDESLQAATSAINDCYIARLGFTPEEILFSLSYNELMQELSLPSSDMTNCLRQWIQEILYDLHIHDEEALSAAA